jgi:hypothetical protein
MTTSPSLTETSEAIKDIENYVNLLEEQNRQYKDALKKIASCKSITRGDCPDIAQEALRK